MRQTLLQSNQKKMRRMRLRPHKANKRVLMAEQEDQPCKNSLTASCPVWDPDNLDPSCPPDFDQLKSKISKATSLCHGLRAGRLVWMHRTQDS